MRSLDWRKWNTAAFLAVVVVNGLANVIPIGGRTTGEVSAMFPVLTSPASYAFSIWGVIYLLLAGFILLQWQQQWKDLSLFRKVGPWFVISCFFNIVWVLLWHYVYIRSSLFMMIGLLLTLVQLYLLTRSVKGAPRDTGLVAKLFVQLPFSIYTAWISVAAAVNVSIWLEVVGWNGWGLGAYWACLALLGAAGIAYAVFRRFKDTGYALTIVWAYVAIGIQQQPTAPVVAWMAWILAGVLTLVVLRILPGKAMKKRM